VIIKLIPGNLHTKSVKNANNKCLLYQKCATKSSLKAAYVHNVHRQYFVCTEKNADTSLIKYLTTFRTRISTCLGKNLGLLRTIFLSNFETRVLAFKVSELQFVSSSHENRSQSVQPMYCGLCSCM
jgi:hypothetical protein